MPRFNRRRNFRRRRRPAFRRRPMRRTRRPRRIMLDPERKAVDVVIGGINVFVNGPLIIPLSLCSAGNGIDQRQGRQCIWTSFQVRMTTNGSPANQSTSLRWFLFLDKMPDQTLVAEGNLLEDPNLPIDSPLNLNNNKRFRVLRTGRYIVRNSVLTAGINPTHQFSLYHKLRVSTRFSGNDNALATVTSNMLYWMVFAGAPTAPTAAVVSTYIRMRFVG